MTKYNKGQSIVEIIVAIAIFLIISSAGVVAVLGSFSTSRLGKEQSQAAYLAAEGIEAVKSIRNQSFDNLVDGSYGLSLSSGTWEFVPSPDLDPSGKFERTIIIETANRDSFGEFTQTGGTPDPNTKIITSEVNWNFTPTNQSQVKTSQILTNWQTARNTPPEYVIETCSEYCQAATFFDGTCRRNPNRCTQNAESYESQGDKYCIQESQNSTCCCQP